MDGSKSINPARAMRSRPRVIDAVEEGRFRYRMFGVRDPPTRESIHPLCLARTSNLRASIIAFQMGE